MVDEEMKSKQVRVTCLLHLTTSISVLVTDREKTQHREQYTQDTTHVGVHLDQRVMRTAHQILRVLIYIEPKFLTKV